MSPQGSDDSPSLEQQVVVELTHLVEPVTAAGRHLGDGNPEQLYLLLNRVDVDEAAINGLEAVEEVVREVYSAFEIIETQVVEGDGFPPPDQIVDLVESFVDIFDAVGKLDDIDLPEDVRSADGRSLGDRVFDYLVARYLRRYQPELHSLFVLTGTVEPGSPPNVDLSMLSDVVSDPNTLVTDVLGWGEQDLNDDLFLFLFRRLATAVGVPADSPEPDARLSNIADHVDARPSSGSSQSAPIDDLTLIDQRLDLEFLRHDVGGNLFLLGLTVVPIPGEKGTALPGVGLVPYGSGKLDFEHDLGNNWSTRAGLSGRAGAWGLAVTPTGANDPTPEAEVRNLQSSTGSPPGEIHGEAALEFDPPSGSPASTLVGDSDGTHLGLRGLSVVVAVDYGGSTLDVTVKLPAAGELVVDPEGGFLSKVLTEIEAPFETTVGWSSVDGVFFEGGASLEASFPSHVELGPISLNELFLALSVGSDDGDSGGGSLPLTFETAASPSLDIGPLTANVKRLGVSVDATFPPDKDGNLGPVDLDVGFRPPDGLGLKLEAGAVSGGGYLEFEPEKNRYAGTFNLSFNDYSVTVVGLLKTELPGGRDGFSLLLLVTGELPPINLGFGFTLNGIGGLVGAHRDMRKKPLRKTVRTGTLDSVLFPENVVENASQIVSDLRTIFPPTTDVFVVGPMAKFGWGTPTLITMDVSVVLAIPRWKIAVLGKISMVLPDEEAAIVELNLAVVGILDIPGKRLSIDASLYDSRIALFDVSGDMAMRSSWGDESRFVLSVGGFHPEYEPPKSFPELRRVKASLANSGGNPKLVLTAYLAVTPNTFQVGAGVVLHAEAGPASVHGELSFDALFRFNPFKFVLDFYAKLRFELFGYGLGIEVDGTLSGPKPWRIKGSVTIEIVFISVTVNVDVSIGSKPEKGKLPSAKVMPELTRAFGQTANWDAQRPEGPRLPVSLRDPTKGSGSGSQNKPQAETVLVHPLGTIRLRQTVVPLGVTIEKYGNAEPVNARFEITDVSIHGRSLGKTGELREKFAPAKFKRMSDSEKLDSQAFEKLKAGRAVGGDRCYYTGQKQANADLLKAATLGYESSIIDEEQDNYRLKPEDKDDWDGGPDGLNVHDTHRLANTGAAGVSEARTSGSAKFENRAETTRDQPTFSVSDTRYVVVSAETLKRVDASALPGVDIPEEGTTQVEAREARDAYEDHHPDESVTVVPTHEVTE